MKFSYLILTAIVTLSTSTVFARGVDIGGDVTQTVAAKNIINLGMGKDVIAEQTLASIRGDVKVGGNVSQTVSSKNIINLAMGKGVTARQTVSSIDSH
jgi:hypothetical protein